MSTPLSSRRTDVEVDDRVFSTPSKAAGLKTPYSSLKNSFLGGKDEEVSQQISQESSILSSVKTRFVEKTPSVVKGEARLLLKKLDSDDGLVAAEQLYSLSLFCKFNFPMINTKQSQRRTQTTNVGYRCFSHRLSCLKNKGE